METGSNRENGRSSYYEHANSLGGDGACWRRAPWRLTPGGHRSESHRGLPPRKIPPGSHGESSPRVGPRPRETLSQGYGGPQGHGGQPPRKVQPEVRMGSYP